MSHLKEPVTGRRKGAGCATGLNRAVAENDIYLNGADSENLWNLGMAALDAADGEFTFWSEVAKDTGEC